MNLFLKLILRPTLKTFLQSRFDNTKALSIENKTWAIYEKLATELPERKNLGGLLTLHLGAATIAFYRAFLDEGYSDDIAIEISYDLCWQIYDKIGDLPNWLVNPLPLKQNEKMKRKTDLFRFFPFGSPSYDMRDVEVDTNTIAFNVHRCHIAEYFQQQGLSNLCVKTWCNLDFPLAEKWGGYLERNSTIAGGQPIDDFNWKVQTK